MAIIHIVEVLSIPMLKLLGAGSVARGVTQKKTPSAVTGVAIG